MEDYQEMSETVGESHPPTKAMARKKAAGKKRQSTKTGKAGARNPKPAPAKKKKPSDGTRSGPKKGKGRPAGGRVRGPK